MRSVDPSGLRVFVGLADGAIVTITFDEPTDEYEPDDVVLVSTEGIMFAPATSNTTRNGSGWLRTSMRTLSSSKGVV